MGRREPPHGTAGTRLAWLGVALALATPGASASLESALRDGTTAYVRGEYRAAATILEAALGPKLIASEAASAEEQAALSDLANLYWLQGRYADAETVVRRLASAARKAGGPDQPQLARELSRLGALLRAQGRYGDAERVFLEVLQLLEPYGVDHAYVATCLASLADLSRLQQRPAEAERRYWRAYMIRSYLYGAESTPVGEALAGLAAVLSAQGRGAEAQPLLARALAIAEKPARTRGWDRLDERDLREMHRPERQTVATRGVMSVRDAGPRHLEHADHFENLGRLYRAHRRFAEAEAMQRRAIEIRQRAFGAEHPEVLESLEEIALARQQQGDAAGALESLRPAGSVAARRIAAWPAERAEQARGERRRWAPLFLLQLAVLRAGPETLEEAFAALQLANVRAGGEAPARVDEARGLLEAGEVLVLAGRREGDLFILAVRRDGAHWQRVEVQAGQDEAAIRRVLGTTSRAYVVADSAPAGTIPLASVGALRARKHARAGQP